MEKEKKRERSRGYPNHNLEESIELARRIKSALGSGKHDRETIAEAWGLQASSANRRVAALVHYGLMVISKEESGSYELSELASRIISPRTREEYNEAISEAALNPTFFCEVFERYKGDELPDLLENVIERDFGITHKQAPEAARVFRETMEFINCLRGNALCQDKSGWQESEDPEGLDDSAGSNSNGEGKESEDEGGSKPPTPPSHRNGIPSEKKEYRQYQIVLDLDRDGYLSLPLPVRLADLEAVSDWIEYTKKRLEKVSPTDSGN